MQSTEAKLTEQEQIFLAVVSAGLRGETLSLGDISRNDFQALQKLANEQMIVPLAGEAIYASLPSPIRNGAFRPMQRQAINDVYLQIVRTAEFSALYDYLGGHGLRPVVMKGILCRALYPKAELRPSADEDLLIEPASFRPLHEALLAYGLELVDVGQDIDAADEVSYEDADTHLYIEVHKTLFPPDSGAYGHLNACFDGVRERSVTERIHGTEFVTLAPADHLLYLILHAFKHFLYSGFGIRQVCDIALFSERYRDSVDWTSIRAELDGVHALDFARALYRIADKYLLPENHMTEYLAGWEPDKIDEVPLLKDILDGGLYGASSMTRLHSSNMTLQAMAGRKKPTALSSVFLPRRSLEGRYPYLKKAPALLPLAWVQRILGYLTEHRDRHAVADASESIHIGERRIALMEQYHIIAREKRAGNC